MTPKQIKDNKPDGATTYVTHQGKVYYLKYLHDRWLVWFDYDAKSGWGGANQTAIKNNLNILKPL